VLRDIVERFDGSSRSTRASSAAASSPSATGGARLAPRLRDQVRESEGRQDLGARLVDRDRLVTRRAILSDRRRAVRGLVLAVVAAEAPGSSSWPRLLGYVPHVTSRSGKTLRAQIAESVSAAFAVSARRSSRAIRRRSRSGRALVGYRSPSRARRRASAGTEAWTGDHRGPSRGPPARSGRSKVCAGPVVAIDALHRVLRKRRRLRGIVPFVTYVTGLAPGRVTSTHGSSGVSRRSWRSGGRPPRPGERRGYAALAASDLHRQHGPRRGARLVVGVLGDNPHAERTSGLPGMTGLAGLGRGDEPPRGEARGDRAAGTSGSPPGKLAGSVDLALDPAGRTGRDMTVHAGHLGVRGDGVRAELRRHNVAALTAEWVVSMCSTAR
jgi:hypothetical protein